MILYESLGTHYINYYNDEILDNPRQIKAGTLWRIANHEEWESLASSKDDIVLLRVYKKKPHNDTGEYLLLTELSLKENFKVVE